MVLVPPYVEVDGLVVPLNVRPPEEAPQARVRQRFQGNESLLEGLAYITSDLLSKPAEQVLSLLETRQRLPVFQGLSALPLHPDYWEEAAQEALNWKSLTGEAPDLSDVYRVGTTFLDDEYGIVIPRTTFIKLMTKLFELNEAVRDGRMEPRIDETIPMSSPSAPLSRE